MKLFKYIVATLVVMSGALVSCSDKDIIDEYEIDKVGGNKALVQIMYMEPMTAATNANRIYCIELNGNKIYNQNTEVLARYNAFPGGAVGLFESVDAGTLNIKLYRGEFKKVPDPEKGGVEEKDSLFLLEYYNQNITLNAGDQGSCVIYDKDKAPVFIPLGEIAKGTTTDEDGTADWAAVRLYNFMFDSNGQPTTGKVQLRMKDVDGDGSYIPLGEPIGFGEATSWQTTYVHKASYNSGGSQRRDLDCVFVDGSGNYTDISWVNSNGAARASFTDYWTLTIGRAYAWYLRGVRDDKSYPIAITQWTCR